MMLLNPRLKHCDDYAFAGVARLVCANGSDTLSIAV